jgi:hypothetical protein
MGFLILALFLTIIIMLVPPSVLKCLMQVVLNFAALAAVIALAVYFFFEKLGI